MKHRLLLLLAVAACLLPGCPSSPTTLPPIETYFSPRGGCTEVIVREIDRAGATIRVQAFSFTSAPIAKALVEAHRRGVKVEVLLDRSHLKADQYSEADFLRNEGIAVWIDAKHEIAHNKIMILDDFVVITGSFNFTKQAEQGNAENLLVIRDPDIARQYTENWWGHYAHCDPYHGREAAAGEPPRDGKRGESRSRAPAGERKRSRAAVNN